MFRSTTATTAPTTSTTAGGSTTTTAPVAAAPKKEEKPQPTMGPPVLDIETMNRVIVDALAAGPNPAPSSYISGKSKSGNGDNLANDSLHNHLRLVAAGTGRSSPPEAGNTSASGKRASGAGNGSAASADHSHPTANKVARLEITAESLREAESQSTLVTAPTSVVSSKVVTSMVNAGATSSAAAGQDAQDDRPLNLSASKVLHASNQQIIDHFIDKLLNTGGECLTGTCSPAFSASNVCFPGHSDCTQCLLLLSPKAT